MRFTGERPTPNTGGGHEKGETKKRTHTHKITHHFFSKQKVRSFETFGSAVESLKREFDISKAIKSSAL